MSHAQVEVAISERNLALSEGDPTIAGIFGFRFNGEGEVGGHSLGNLILTALSQLEKDFPRAVERAGEMLGVRGRVYPSTSDEVTLSAEFIDGSHVHGESRIAPLGRAIRQVRLQPEGARALPKARKAITAADLVVIGPGSLYTSLMPILLVQDLARAIAQSCARVILVMNLMTESGETDGYTAADVVLAIRRHVPELLIHDVLLNTAPIPGALIDRYTAKGSTPIRLKTEPLRVLGCRPVERDLLGPGPRIRHDPQKLARAVLELSR